MSLQLPCCPLPDAPVLVALSGGLDSTVLMHALAATAGVRATGLRALHVHHGLHADADAWAAHCTHACATLDVPLLVVNVKVPRHSGLGLEGAARAARHHAFDAALGDGEILALAHHRDDQAETLLLRALRGSGVDGLAAMRPWRAYARGWLWRPLLGFQRDALRAFATRHALHWIEDPTNVDASFDRSFLRTRVLPLLQERWPHADAALARSACLAAQASDLLAHEDDVALSTARIDDHTLDANALLALPPPRRARVLRRWITALGLPPLPGSGVDCIEAGLLRTRPDAQPRFDWHGARVQRWRGLLHAAIVRAPLPDAWSATWDGRAPLQLPTGDTLALLGAGNFEAPLRAHARQGGEQIQLPGRAHRHTLKRVLQAQGIPPWERHGMPMLSQAGGELLAAGDAILSAHLAAWLGAQGATLYWRKLPACPANH